MSDPIKDLGKAAEAYIHATAEDGEDPGAAFRETRDALAGFAERDSTVSTEDRRALQKESWESDWTEAAWTPGGDPAMQFQQRQEQRDFADMAVYLAADPEAMAAQPVRIATPIPVPDGLPEKEHTIVDTGRYTLMVKPDGTVREFDKATGEEEMLHRDHDYASRFHVGSEHGPPLIYADDGTFVVFADDMLVVVKYDKQEDDEGDGIFFPVDPDAPADERVKVHDFDIRPYSESSDIPDDGAS